MISAKCRFRHATKKTIAVVLRVMADQCDDDKDDAEAYAEALDPVLDELYREDFFGTEGQCDPRGDHRS